MAQQPFPITSFQFNNMQPVANGYLLVNLNKDARCATGNISSGVKVKIPLDANGNLTQGNIFYPNIEIFPMDTVYVYSVYDSAGQRVAGPLFINIGYSLPPKGFGLSFGTYFGS